MVDDSLLISLANRLLVLGSKTTSSLSFLSSSFFSFYFFLHSSCFVFIPFPLTLLFFSLTFYFSLSFLFLLVHSLPPLTLSDNCFTLLLWVFLGICHEIAYGFLASCLASCPTWTSKFLIGNFVLLWLDMHTCINLVNVSSSLVVVFYKLGPWLGGRLDGPPWSLFKWFPGWDLQPWP